MAGNHLHSRVITYDHREAKKIRALISTKMIVKILIKLFVEEVKFNFVIILEIYLSFMSLNYLNGKSYPYDYDKI